MTDISATLRNAYSASAVAIVPGGGTYGMEAVARQFARDKSCLVLRNGWFSYRWTQIFEMAGLPAKESVLKARRTSPEKHAAWEPCPIDEVVAAIREQKPDLVFAPHVETSSGMILPDEYLKVVASEIREVGGLFVLDCVASGAIWIDMQDLGVDILISAPQKGWSGSPCAGLVMLGDRAQSVMAATSSDSFACDLKKWRQIMQAYENGGHAYHATMPTDALRSFRNVMTEIETIGFSSVCQQQRELGGRIRKVLEERGFPSVAGDGYKAPGVVVSYTDDPEIRSGARFASAGIQIAAGVPLQCDEPDDFQTFRLGLFGLDKLQDVERTVQSFSEALDIVLSDERNS